MRKLICISLLCICSITASATHTISVLVSNPISSERKDQPVVISLKPYGEVRSALVTVNGQEIPCQLDDLDQDETFDELCFLADFNKKEQKRYFQVRSVRKMRRKMQKRARHRRSRF